MGCAAGQKWDEQAGVQRQGSLRSNPLSLWPLFQDVQTEVGGRTTAGRGGNMCTAAVRGRQVAGRGSTRAAWLSSTVRVQAGALLTSAAPAAAPASIAARFRLSGLASPPGCRGGCLAAVGAAAGSSLAHSAPLLRGFMRSRNSASLGSSATAQCRTISHSCARNRNATFLFRHHTPTPSLAG